MVQLSTPGVTPNRGMGPPPVRRFLSNYFDLLFMSVNVCVYYCGQSRGYAVRSVSLSFIHSFIRYVIVFLSVCRITSKLTSQFHWNLVLGLCLPVGRTWLTFNGNPCMDSKSLFRFLHYCGICNFTRFISISHTVIGQFSWHLAKRLPPTE